MSSRWPPTAASPLEHLTWAFKQLPNESHVNEMYFIHLISFKFGAKIQIELNWKLNDVTVLISTTPKPMINESRDLCTNGFIQWNVLQTYPVAAQEVAHFVTQTLSMQIFGIFSWKRHQAAGWWPFRQLPPSDFLSSFGQSCWIGRPLFLSTSPSVNETSAGAKCGHRSHRSQPPSGSSWRLSAR